jgi:hypothetical protein
MTGAGFEANRFFELIETREIKGARKDFTQEMLIKGRIGRFWRQHFVHREHSQRGSLRIISQGCCCHPMLPGNRLDWNMNKIPSSARGTWFERR